MSKTEHGLLRSLVGSSIEFRFGKAVEGGTSLEGNIKAAKRRIDKNVEEALSVGGAACVSLLGELTSYYSKQVYYMAVRGNIVMHRYRPMVLGWMESPSEHRFSSLLTMLKQNKKDTPLRAVIVEAVRYFVSTYERYTLAFKPVLTKEEFLLIC